MKKHALLKFLPVILVIILLPIFYFPSPALGWSAVNLISACHSKIDGYAYDILSSDPAFRNVHFPSIADIQDNDYVTVLKTGTGPDVPGRTNGGDHYYNPRLESISGLAKPGAGGGPDAVFDQFTKLVYAYSSGDPQQLAHAASWAAHFSADLFTPYHTQGISRADIEKIYESAGGKNAISIPLPSYITGPLSLSGPVLSHPNDFVWEVRRFLEETAGPNQAKEDWFDPWYWDGIGNHVVESSHVVFEGITHVFPGTIWSFLTSGDTGSGATGYSSMWRNPAPSFNDPVGNQAAQVRKFAVSEAKVAQAMVDGSDFSQASIFSDVTAYLQGAIESAATVWRASFSALAPTISFSIPDKSKPNKFKVTGTVANMAQDTALNVQVKLTVTGGTIKSGKSLTEPVSLDGNMQQSYDWEVEGVPLGFCTFKMEVIGQYDNTPDLQYAVTSVTAPGILPVTTQTGAASRDHSIVFCLDNSGSMDGQPIIDAMDAGVQAVNAAQFAGVEMAVYFFGTNECDPPQRVVDFTLNRDTIKAAILTASARGNTPLAAAITAAGDYIRSNARGQEATIILLTDGMETCGGDPLAAARALNPSINLSWNFFSKAAYASNNIPISLQVVGFNLDSPDYESYLSQVAQAGNGKYYSATGVQQLVDALTTVVKQATDQGGVPVWWYIAGGAAFLLVLVLLISRSRRARVPADTTAAPAQARVMSPPRVARRPSVSPPGSGFFCPACGSLVPAGASFCTGCGSNVALAAPIASPAAISQTVCPKCGFKNAADSVFCGKCGSSLAEQNLAYCTQCGVPVAVGSAFCNKCGNAISAKSTHSAAPAVRQRNMTYCPQCGTPNAVGSGFCNKCGVSMTLSVNEPAAAAAQTRAPSVKAPSPFWWFLPFFLGIVGGLIAWLALKDRNRDVARRLLIMGVAWTVLVVVSYVTSTFS